MIILRQKEYSLKSSFRHLRRDVINFKNNISISNKVGAIQGDLNKNRVIPIAGGNPLFSEQQVNGLGTMVTRRAATLSPSEVKTMMTKSELLARYGKNKDEKAKGRMFRREFKKNIEHPENGAVTFGSKFNITGRIPSGGTIRFIDKDNNIYK